MQMDFLSMLVMTSLSPSSICDSLAKESPTLHPYYTRFCPPVVAIITDYYMFLE